MPPKICNVYQRFNPKGAGKLDARSITFALGPDGMLRVQHKGIQLEKKLSTATGTTPEVVHEGGVTSGVVKGHSQKSILEFFSPK